MQNQDIRSTVKARGNDLAPQLFYYDIIHDMEPLLSWDAPEHMHIEKSNDWYWSISIITITIASLAFIFGNAIFGIFILVSAFALIAHGSQRPKIVHYEINDRGLMANDILYPYLGLDSFWIDAHEKPSKILIKSHKMFMPFIIVYIEEVDPEKVREVLLTYIAEKEHHEHFTQRLLEWLGF